MSSHQGVLTGVFAIATALAFIATANADERFSFSVDPQGHLLLVGTKGEPVADVSAPTLARRISADGHVFDVSFGRDAGGLMTAVVAASDAVHLTSCGRSIDANSAVVTLTYSSDAKSVSVDPGYVGTVDVDAHRLSAHRLAESASPEAAPASSAVTTDVATAPAPAAPPILASQLAPLLPPVSNTTAAPSETPQPNQPIKLYWSEPVTPPDGKAPAVGANEIRLVEVHGSVEIVNPTGETTAGSEGMIVPSGSTLRALEHSSAALFMAGINSARLLPECELVVTQSIEGSVRKTLLDLHRGAVFSRVGTREGETQDFQVHTPEGSTDAETTEMLSFRGNLEDLQQTASTGLVLDRKNLLAWSGPASRNLESDVVDSMLAASSKEPACTYFYFAGKNLVVDVAHIRHLVYTAIESKTLASSPDKVLQAIFVVLQPFNCKLHDLLYRVNSGTGTPGDLAFYHNLVTVFFSQQLPALVSDYKTDPKAFRKIAGAASKILGEDLQPFGVPCFTPF